MIKDYRQLMLLSKRGLSTRQIARIAGCKWERARDALERMNEVMDYKDDCHICMRSRTTHEVDIISSAL